MSIAIPLTITERSAVAREAAPVQTGVPLAEGAVADLSKLRVVDAAGKTLPAQFESLSKWDDGSHRWVLVNLQQSLDANASTSVELRDDAASAAPAPTQPVRITEANDVFTVDTGRLRFDVPIYAGVLLQNIQRKTTGGAWHTVSKHGLEAVIWRTGVKPFHSKIESCTLESVGPVKSVIKIEGHHRMWDPMRDAFDPSEEATFAFIVRVICWAGSDELKLQYTFINDHRDHRVRPSERYHTYELEELRDFKWVNGRWVERPEGIRFRERELLDDDYGQVNAKVIKLRLKLDDSYARYAVGVIDGEPVTGEIAGPVGVQQVGPMPHYDGFFKQLPFPHVPFKATVLHGRGPAVAEFEKAAGWLTMSGDAGQVLVAGKYHWQYHPRIMACDPTTLEYHVWSKLEDVPDPEIGFAKTHEITLQFADVNAALDPAQTLANLHSPLRAIASPQHYLGADVFGTYSPAKPGDFEGFDAHLLASTRNAENHREKNGRYGVRDFGDTAFIRFNTPINTNQEYDIMLGAMVQFARTGELAFLDECDVLAWHFMDVDVLHASNSPLNEQGQHMHFTDHAKGETHAGHGTVEGLWHFYMLTGERRACEVATGIANFFAKVAAWKDFLDFRDDEERTIGWALRALVSSYRATRDPRYKLAAQMVVEQAIAGQDAVTGNWDHPLYPNEDKERPTRIGGKPWFVGIILQGMKRYYREFGDERVHALILKAADWMVWSEYRYMTAPDQPVSKGQDHHLEALAYAWELSGRRYLLDEALQMFEHLTARLSGKSAGEWTPRGGYVEALADMIRIIDEQGTKVWRDGKPVLDPASGPKVKAMRADTKFQPKPQRRY
jgi:hypothetical protein